MVRRVWTHSWPRVPGTASQEDAIQIKVCQYDKRKRRNRKERQEREWVNTEQAACSDKHTRARRRVTPHRIRRRARLRDIQTRPTASPSHKAVHIPCAEECGSPCSSRGPPSREAAYDAMHHHPQSGGSRCADTYGSPLPQRASPHSNLEIIGTRKHGRRRDRKAGVWRAEWKGRERDGEVKREHGVGKRKQTHTVY
ncbi:hypothetical protein B0H13DRAFT_881481 [Mycena leptocephala]|nr:hypothetical protein B0H13DRAFT_881481 [Mycena leptocephala]